MLSSDIVRHHMLRIVRLSSVIRVCHPLIMAYGAFSLIPVAGFAGNASSTLKITSSIIECITRVMSSDYPAFLDL
jgi:hypothetical protein